MKTSSITRAASPAAQISPSRCNSSLSTIDPATPSGAEITIEERDPAEVSADGDGFNPAFDVTPAELVTAVITQAGVLEPPYQRSVARARG